MTRIEYNYKNILATTFLAENYSVLFYLILKLVLTNAFVSFENKRCSKVDAKILRTHMKCREHMTCWSCNIVLFINIMGIMLNRKLLTFIVLGFKNLSRLCRIFLLHIFSLSLNSTFELHISPVVFIFYSISKKIEN